MSLPPETGVQCFKCPVCLDSNVGNQEEMTARLIYTTCYHQICMCCEQRCIQNALSAKISDWDFSEIGPIMCVVCQVVHTIDQVALNPKAKEVFDKWKNLNDDSATLETILDDPKAGFFKEVRPKQYRPAFTKPERGFFSSSGHRLSVAYHCFMALISEVVLAILYLGDQGFIGEGTYRTWRDQNVMQRLTRLFIKTYGVQYNESRKSAEVTQSGGYGIPSVKAVVEYDPALTLEKRIWQNLSTFMRLRGS